MALATTTNSSSRSSCSSGPIAHWETSLHGVELIPGLDLRRGQRHRHAMTNAIEGDLLNAGQNVVEAGIDEGAPSANGIRGHIRRQLEGLQLQCQG